MFQQKNHLIQKFIIDGRSVDRIHDVQTIHEDRKGIIWLGTNEGLYKVQNINQRGNQLVVELTDLTYKIPHSFINFSSSISALIEDQNGDIWIGGGAGLVYYQIESDEWRHFIYDIDNPQSLSNDGVQVIYEDSQGFLWVGTADGLNRVIRSSIDPNTFYFERITTYQGLPNNAIYGILEDADQKLWISTTRGLVRYAQNAVDMDIFRSIDGLSSDEFNTGAYFADSNGRLYFGTINGITIVNHVPEKENKKNSSILFTSLKVGERKIDTYKLNHSYAPSITQRSDEVAIDISVANISYGKLGTQRYRYRIIGLDDEWNYLGVRRSMFIAGLTEGNYLIEIESKLSDQDWSGQVKTLKVIVNSSFWNSIQAYYLIAFSVFVLFGLSMFLVMRFYKIKLKKSSNKMSIENLRMREVRSDNESLKTKLKVSEQEIVALTKRQEIGERQLEVERFRDVITGFYRFSYLRVLDESEIIDIAGNINSNEQKTMSGFSVYTSIAVLELSRYSEILREYGTVAAAELLAKTSVLIRQKSDSKAQIFCADDGVFIILSSNYNKQVFDDGIQNLRHQIVRTEYDISNGMFVNTDVLLSIMDVSQLNIANKKELLGMIELLTMAHRYVIDNKGHKVNSIKVNHSAQYFSENISQDVLIKLIKESELEIIPA